MQPTLPIGSGSIKWESKFKYNSSIFFIAIQCLSEIREDGSQLVNREVLGTFRMKPKAAHGLTFRMFLEH